ncbi:MAG: 30S ribosomal protein S17 [Candidatus Pacebacteria bacterium]|nr:30S ribosomal protein S17 [Candidatus Paceibacterota bacterium]
METKVIQKNKGKVLVGKVVSTKMKDTVVISIDSFKKHPKYGKYIKRQNKIMAHDLGNKCKEGQTIKIVESKPISKNKRFTVLEK